MKYKICKRCVMDTTDSAIVFDKNGYCNHCREALNIKNDSVIEGKKGQDRWNQMIEELKKNGKNKEYDCVIGISGGIDSSYLAYLLSKEGLRILGIHIDGGWNTKESNKNIEIIRDKCNIDLKIIKINEREMMDLQRAYFLAEVPNLDVPQDHAFFAELYKFMKKHNIKYFISGHNWASESITPISWGFDAYDSDNIRDIHKKYGKIKLKEYPILSFFENKIMIPYVYKIKKLRPLDWIDYNPIEAKKILIKKIGFIDYGSKHCESVFTRLLQSYIQPKKFGYDKRRAHLSSMIVAGLITREQAIDELKNNYVDDNQIEQDIKKFIEKINITRFEFDKIINNKNINSHNKFKTFGKKNKIFNAVKKKLKNNKS